MGGGDLNIHFSCYIWTMTVMSFNLCYGFTMSILSSKIHEMIGGVTKAGYKGHKVKNVIL